jgi:vitamin K-dependent gamma-carboxylase
LIVNSVLRFLFRPTHPSTLSIFRIVFGLVMTYQTIYYIQIDYTYQFMSGPQLLFSYSGLEFLQPLPEPTLKVLQWGMLGAGLLFTLGLLYRLATAYLLVVFSYFSFIDKTLYNNHLYLFSLLLLCFLFVDAHKMYALRLKKGADHTASPPVSVPYWQLFIFQFLIFVAYFYGGIAKLDSQWLNMALPRIMVSKVVGDSPLIPYLAVFFAYGGLLYDLSIGFLLLWKKTRWIAVVLVLIFNLTNGFFLFDDIGVFPFFMIGGTIVFFDPERVHQWLSRRPARGRKKRKANKARTTPPLLSTPFGIKHYVTATILLVFIGFHLIFPLRHLWLTDHPEWTGIASKFAWRMKLQHYDVQEVAMTIQDGIQGRTSPIDVPSFLTSNQVLHFFEDPFQVVQLAKHLREEGLKRGMTDPVVKARVVASLNGRPHQLMFEPMVDLSRVTKDMNIYLWLMPLQEK